MNKKKFFSLFLAVSLVIQTFPLSVIAQSEVTTTQQIEAPTNPPVVIDGVKVENGDGVVITAKNGNDANVTTGDIEASETGIKAEANGEDSSITAETGEITAGDNGVEAASTDGGTVEIKTDDIQSDDTGVDASSDGQGSATTIDVAGEVNAAGDGWNDAGIDASSSDGGTTVVTAESVQSESTGVEASSSGAGSSTTVEVSGSVESSGSDWNDAGIDASSSDGGTTVVQAESVQSESTGVEARSGGEGSSTTVEVSGEVSSESTGISAGSSNGGTTEVTARSVESESSTGISAYSSGEGSSTTVEVSGEINSKYDGIYAYSYGGSTTEVHAGSVQSESGSGVSAYSSVDSSSTTVEVSGEINSEYTGIYADSYNSGTTKVTVDGDVIAGDEGVVVQSSGENSQTIVKTEDITLNSENPMYYQSGVEIMSNNGGTSQLTAGNIVSNNRGVYANSEGGTTILETGNITAEERGMTIYINDGGSLDVTVQGDIESGQGGIQVLRVDEEGTANITVNGNITGRGGVGINGNEGTVDLTVHNITATENGGNALSIYRNSGEININADEIVSETNNMTTVAIYNTDKGSVTISTKDITTQGTNSISARNVGEGSSIEMTVDGDVSSNTSIYNYQGIIELSIAGDSRGNIYAHNSEGLTNISVEGDTKSIDAINYYQEGGELNISVEGDVNDYLFVSGNGKSQTQISVDGNIDAENSNGYGLVAYGYSDSEIIDVLVSGTISGEKVAVRLGQMATDAEGNEIEGYPDDRQSTADSMTLTVWKIELNEAGHAVESVNHTVDEEGNHIDKAIYDDVEQKFEQSILYIIKLEQPEGAVLRATDADGNAMEKSHDYEVAHEGDTVLMKIDVQSGFELYGAYNGLGERVPLLQDANGNFYVEVPKGGGVYLSARLGRIVSENNNEEQNDDEEKRPEWKPQTFAAIDENFFTVTYEPTGGAYSDEIPLNYQVRRGGTHIILKAPEREGYRFLYWIGSAYSRDDPRWIEADPLYSYPYAPGAWFTMPGSDWTFTAVWDEIK